MKSERGRAFAQNAPTLTNVEIDAAYSAGLGVISFTPKAVAFAEDRVGLVALKVILENGSDQLLLFDELASRNLWAFLQRLEEMDWNPSIPDGEGGMQ